MTFKRPEIAFKLVVFMFLSSHFFAKINLLSVLRALYSSLVSFTRAGKPNVLSKAYIVIGAKREKENQGKAHTFTTCFFSAALALLKAFHRFTLRLFDSWLEAYAKSYRTWLTLLWYVPAIKFVLYLKASAAVVNVMPYRQLHSFRCSTMTLLPPAVICNAVGKLGETFSMLLEEPFQQAEKEVNLMSV